MAEQDLLKQLEDALDAYMSSVNGVDAIFIGTLDGHLLIERSRKDHPLDQLAPMAGSVLGISETLSSQLLQQKLQDNIIIMERNIFGLLKIQDKEDALFLGILCDRLVNLGKMISFGKLTIKDINKILQGQDFL
jgi:predicted regulator of Ras-like GTPase activity (Roadblock/LC7/MglB family)